MTAGVRDLWTALEDLELAARHLIARPTNAGARAVAKRACARAASLRALDAAQARAMDALDPDPRPAAPPAAPSNEAEKSNTGAGNDPAPLEHAWQQRKDING